MKRLILIIKLGGSFKKFSIEQKTFSLFVNLSERHFNVFNVFLTFTSPLIIIIVRVQITKVTPYWIDKVQSVKY